MSRFTYIFNFTDEPTAIADGVVGQWYVPPSTRRGIFLPGFWNTNSAVAPLTMTGPPSNDDPPVYTAYSGFWLMHDSIDDDPTLDAHPNVVLVYDPDVYGEDGVITNNLGDLTQYYLSPAYSGDLGPFPNSPSQ